MKDCESALILNGNCLESITNKAEALYIEGSFEKSLLLFTRCSFIVKSTVIIKGMRKSRSAIINNLKNVKFSPDIVETLLKSKGTHMNKTRKKKLTSTNVPGRPEISSMRNIPGIVI